MHKPELREAVVARLNRGERVEALAAETNLPRPTLFHWRRKSCRARKKRPPVARNLPGLWAFPDPQSEAQALLKIADLNGGRAKMQELIRVTPADEANLRRMVTEGQLSAHLVEKAIAFRAEVMQHFAKGLTSPEKNQNRENLMHDPGGRYR